METNRTAQQVFNCDWEIEISPTSLAVVAPSQSKALKLVCLEPEVLANWAQRFGFEATLVKYPGGKHYRIPASMAGITMSNETLVLDPENPLIEIYALSLSPCLYKEIGWFLENPTQAGSIVRVVDHQQVAMSYANAHKGTDYTAGAGVKKAVSWKREEFWHPVDLADFDRDWKQRLEPNNPHSWMEYKWRSFDPELGLNAEDGWIEFANRCKLLMDRLGNSYHISWNLGMSDIAKPVGI